MSGDDPSDDFINNDDLGKILKSEQPMRGLDESNCKEDESIIDTSKNKTDTRCNCNFCGESFSNSSQLKRHLIDHTAHTLLRLSLNPHLKTHPPSVPIAPELPEMGNFKEEIEVHEHDWSEDPCKSEPFEEEKINELVSAPEIDDERKSSSSEAKSQSNIANELFVCHHCGKEYIFKNSLKKHLEMHMDQKRLQCDICPKRFSQRSKLLSHKNVHTANKQFKCDYCGKVYLLRDSLRYHLQMHIKKDGLGCDILCNKTYCGKVYSLPSSLNRHLKTHQHCGPATPEPPKMEDVKEDIIEIQEHNLSEDLCKNEPFEEEKIIELVSAPEIDDERKSSSSQAKSQSNIVADDKHTSPNLFECDICNKTFRHKGRMLNHRNGHTANKQYVCHHCGKVYLIKNSLKRHLEVHMDQRSLQCDICQKRFSYRFQLLLHKNVHTANKQFKCEYCDKVYLLRGSLRQHRQMHIKKDDLSCDICNKKFALKYCLSLHRKKHIANEQYVNEESHTVQKLHKCQYCAKVYTAASSLNRHLKTHRHNLPATPEPPRVEDFKEQVEIHEHVLSEDICKSEPFEKDKIIDLLSAPEVDDEHKSSTSEDKPN